jgi:hypothetical protein
MLAAVTAAAQTRTAEIEKTRDAKVPAMQPEKVSRLEDVMLQFKQRKVLERITAGYNGLRVQIGSLATGSGFAAGPQFFREELLNGQMRIDVSAVISTRLWQKYQAGVAAPHLAGDRLSLRVEAVRRNYRSLEFYGAGLDSSPDRRTNYRLEDTSLDGSAAVRLTRHIRFGASLGGLWTEIGPGEHGNSVQRFFRSGS